MKRTRNATQAAQRGKLVYNLTSAKRGKISKEAEANKEEDKTESDFLSEFELSGSRYFDIKTDENRKQNQYTLDDMLAEKKQSGNKSITDIILEVQKELASSESASSENSSDDAFDSKSSEVSKVPNFITF